VTSTGATSILSGLASIEGSAPPSLSLPSLPFFKNPPRSGLLFLFHRLSIPHRVHADCVAVPAQRAKSHFGSNYGRVVRALFECVDPSVGAGRAMAWEPRPGAAEWIESQVFALPRAEAPGPEHRCSDREDVRTVYVNRAPLVTACFPTSGAVGGRLSPRSARYLCSQIHPDEEWRGTRGVLVESYRAHHPGGRLFGVGPALQWLSQETRASLLGGFGYVDVDVVNAHPEILNQLTGGRFPELVEYCAHRESWLAELMRHYGVDRTRAKKIVIVLIFGATLRGESLTDLVGDQEAAALVRRLAGLPKRVWSALERDAPASVLKYARSLKKSAGSKVALTAQWHEARVLRACDTFHRARGESVDVLMFDGYAVRAAMPPRTVADLSHFVLRETGLELNFKVEPIVAPWIRDSARFPHARGDRRRAR